MTDFKAIVRVLAEGGGPKDLEAIAELEAIVEERRRAEGR